MRTVHGCPYTFSVKPKWRTVVFWFFAARSSAEAYLRSSPPRGHSTVGAPKRCEGFVAICLRAREDIAANRFQLLFINIDGENQGFGPKIPDHPFRGHFVSGSGGLGTRLGLSRHNRSPLFPVRPDRICRKYSVPRTIYFRNIRSASEIFGPPRSPADERPRI